MCDFATSTTDAILAERIREVETKPAQTARSPYLLPDLTIDTSMVRSRAFKIALADQKANAAFAAKYSFPQKTWAELYDRAYSQEMDCAEQAHGVATAWRDHGASPEWRAAMYDFADCVGGRGKFSNGVM